MKKRFLSLLLSVTMVAAMLPVTSLAAQQEDMDGAGVTAVSEDIFAAMPGEDFDIFTDEALPENPGAEPGENAPAEGQPGQSNPEDSSPEPGGNMTEEGENPGEALPGGEGQYPGQEAPGEEGENPGVAAPGEEAPGEEGGNPGEVLPGEENENPGEAAPGEEGRQPGDVPAGDGTADGTAPEEENPDVFVDSEFSDELQLEEEAETKQAAEEFTSGDYTYTLEEGNATITKYTGNSVSVAIPETLDGHTVTEIGISAFEGCSFLENIFIPETVTEIGRRFIAGTSVVSLTVPKSVVGGEVWYFGSFLASASGALSGCDSIHTLKFEDGATVIPRYFCCEAVNLTNVIIPDTVTTIEPFAFLNCSSLTELKIPKSVTSLGGGMIRGTSIKTLTIPKRAKANTLYSNDINYSPVGHCDSLETVILEEGMETISDKFFCEAHVQNVVIPDTVKSIGVRAFSLSDIKNLSLPDSVETIGECAFMYCRELESIRLSKSLKFIGNEAFCECLSLKELILPESLTAMGEEIIRDTPLTSITIPENVAEAKSALKNCETLETVIFENGMECIPDSICYAGRMKKIVLPDTLTTIGNHSFSKCYKLIDLQMPDSVTTIGNYAFFGCCDLPDIQISHRVKKIGDYAFSGCGGLKDISELDALETIGEFAFKSCNGLTDISIPDNVTVIGSKAFLRCEHLERVVLPSGFRVIPMGLFSNCTALTFCEIPEGVVEIKEYAFEGCSALTELTLPESVRILGNGIIKNTSVTSITIPKNVTSASSSLGYCETLKTVIFAEGTTLIPGFIFFESCVENVVIPETVTEVANSAFYKSKMREITIPGSVHIIRDRAFSSCANLESVIFEGSDRNLLGIGDLQVKEVKDEDPESHAMELQWSLKETDLLDIGYEVFSGCGALKSISFSNGLSIIGYAAFRECNALTEVSYPGSEEDWLKVTGRDELPRSVTMHYTPKNPERNPDGFEVQISLQRDFLTPQKELIPFESLDSLKTVIKAEEKEKYYYIRLRAYAGDREADGQKVIRYGSWSNVATLKVENIATERDVQRSAKKLYELMELYLKDLKTEAEAGSKNYKNGGKTQGQLLQEADAASNDKLFTRYANIALTQGQTTAIYSAMADYISGLSAFNLDKIKASDDGALNKSAKKITDAVAKNLNENSEPYVVHTAAGVIEFRPIAVNFSKAFSNRVFLNNREIGVFSSGMNGTWDAMLKYLQNLRSVVNDLMYQALTSIFSDLGKVTGLSDFLEKDIKDRLAGFEDELLEAGFGELQKKLYVVQECGNVIKDIKKAASDTELKKILESSEEIYEKIDKMDFSDKQVVSVLLKNAYGELENQRNDLAKTLYAFTYGQEKEAPKSWVGKAVRKLIGCPVDLIIRGSNGEILGSVIDGRASYTPQITILVKGDTKEIWMASNLSHSIELIGTGTGTMSCIVQETSNRQVVAQDAYYNIPLKEGLVYKQSGNSLGYEMVTFSPSISWSANQDPKLEYVTITRSAAKGGAVRGDSGSFEKGTRALVTAEPEKGYRFAGWYEGEQLVSSEAAYYFTAVKDVSLEARFQKEIVYNSSFGMVLGDGYQGQARVYLLQETQKADKLVLCLESDAESIPAILKEYTTSDAAPATRVVSLVREGEDRYVLPDMNLSPYSKVEILDENQVLIATVLPKSELPREICEDGKHDFDLTEEKAPGCASRGCRMYTCFYCDEEKKEDIPATGKHTYGGWKTDRAATVLKTGQKSRKCTQCEKKLVQSIPKLNPTLKLSASTLTLKPGKAASIKVTGLANGDSVKSWKSGKTSVAKVDIKGKITAKKKGTAVITVTLASGKTGKVKVTVSAPAPKKIKGIPASKTLKKGKKLKLKPKLSPAGSTAKITYKSSNKKIATVNAKGVVTAKKPGKVKITIKAGKLKKICKITVK